MSELCFTPELTRELQDKYDEAVADGHEQFDFHGHSLLVVYAKYLLQYLNQKFGIKEGI